MLHHLICYLACGSQLYAHSSLADASGQPSSTGAPLSDQPLQAGTICIKNK
jgi:hypothetical protein